MPKITFNGVDYWIPGVYSTEEVISFLAGASMTFQVPVLLGASDVGYPHTFDDDKFTHEADRGPFTYCGTTAAVRAVYGDDSELTQAFTMGKRHGLPNAYVANLCSLTRAKVVATSVGPVNQMTIYSELFGAIGGWHKITYSAVNVMTITPVTRHTPITTAVAATDKRIYVRDNSWAVTGMTVEVGSNTIANATKVVLKTGYDISSTGQKAYWIEFGATVGAILALADYPMVAYYDPTKVEVSPTLTTGQEIVDWVNTSKYLRAVKHTAFTGALLIPTAILPIKQLALWAAPTVGTSPALAASDYTDFITLMDAEGWDSFVTRYGVLPRLFCLVSSDSTAHGNFRDWAIAKRAENNPIAVVAGCAWGDIVISSGTTTDPGFRAMALNSQDFQLVAGGLDYLASYLSTAPAVWGLRAAGGPWHNLTEDRLTFSTLEVAWDERNSGKLTYLHQKGVTTYRLSIDNGGAKWVVSEGLSTLQNNTQSWNTGTNDTPLVSQRDVADYCQREQRFVLVQTQLGQDDVDRNTVAATLNRKMDSLQKQGFLTSYTIASIDLNSTGTGWDAVVSHVYPTTTDFITVTTQVVVGEE